MNTSTTSGIFVRGAPVKKFEPPHLAVSQLRRSLTKNGGTDTVSGAAGLRATKGDMALTSDARCCVVKGQHRCSPCFTRPLNFHSQRD